MGASAPIFRYNVYMAFIIPNQTDETYPNASRLWRSDIEIIRQGYLNWIKYDATNTCAVTPGGGRTVDVDDGVAIFNSSTGLRVSVTGQNVTLVPASSAPRIDVIEVGSAGVPVSKTGIASGNPVPPNPSTNSIALAYVYNEANDTGAIETTDIVDKRIIKDDGNWLTYTPALTAVTTNPSLGTGSTASGIYTILGNLVVGSATIIWGTSGTAGSGNYRVTIPIDTTSNLVGHGGIDIGAGTRYHVVSLFRLGTGTSTCEMYTFRGAGGTTVNHTFGLGGSGEYIKYNFHYRIQ